MIKTIKSPHDKFFRASLKHKKVAKEFFKTYLPKKALKVIDFSLLEPWPELHVSKHLLLSSSDVIYRAPMHGRMGYIYLAVEHQSHPEQFLPLRILKYNISIWDAERAQRPYAKKLPLIINLLFYTGKRAYTCATNFKDLLDAPESLVDVFFRKLEVIQLKDLTDESLLHQPWTGLFMYLMKYIRTKDLFNHIDKIVGLIKLLEIEKALDYIETAVFYAVSAGNIHKPLRFIETLKNTLSKEIGERIMTGAQRLIKMGINQGIQEGIQKGIQLGKQEGALEGERLMLMHLIKCKFGHITPNLLSVIKTFSVEDLLILSEKILEAKTLAELFECKNFAKTA